MSKSHPALISLLILTLALLSCPASCQFDTTRLHIVDQNPNHFLIRGNLPIINNTFQFEKLYDTLGAMTNMTGFRIVIYSLLNLYTAKETKSRYIEENLFNHEGQYKFRNTFHLYRNHDILGTYWSPAQYPEFLRKWALKWYNITSYDKIPQLMTMIERNMKSPFKTIVYVHCSQGVDRAGYVSAAYKMKNKNVSLADAMRENLQIMKSVRGHMHFNSFNGLQWYCLFLGRSEEECLVHVQGANRGNTIKGVDSYPKKEHGHREEDKKTEDKKSDKKSEKKSKKEKKQGVQTEQ